MRISAVQSSTGRPSKAKVVIGIRGDDKALADLVSKTGKTTDEALREILLRIKRIEEHMGISD